MEDFSVAVSYDEIKEKGYSLSAGQYFDIKIDYVDITEEEFNFRMADYKQILSEQFARMHCADRMNAWRQSASSLSQSDS